MLRYSARLNSLDYLAITRLDILDNMPKIKMCVGYKIGDEVLKRIPASLNVLAKVEPIFEEFDGWMTDISGIRNYDELPENAKNIWLKSARYPVLSWVLSPLVLTASRLSF